MKRFAIFAFFVAIVAADPTYAIPVQYQYAATQHIEYASDIRNPFAASDYLIADSVAVSATFYYDADIPAILSNDSTLLGSSSYGLASIYSGAVTQFSGAVDGHVFSFGSGITVIADSVTGGSTLLDGVFNAGLQNTPPGYPVTVSFQGFSIDEFALAGVSVYSVGFNDFLADQSLPAQLANGPLTTSISLTFYDTQNNVRHVLFQRGSIAAVPVPTSGLLFMSGLCGLFTAARKRLKQ